MKRCFTANTFVGSGQVLFKRFLLAFFIGQTAGCNLPEAKVTASIVSSPIGACTTSDCEISFESDAGLSPAAVDASGVLQVSEGQSTADAVVISETSTLIIKGYAIVASTATCLTQEPITNITPPAIKDVYAMGEGRWNICVAVVRNGSRQLLRSPEIVVDLTAPLFAGAISVTGNNTLTPTLSWPTASDNFATASDIKYQVRVSESQMSTITDALTSGEFREVQSGSTAVQMSDLIAGKTYYAVVIAVDRAGNAKMMSQTSFLTGYEVVVTPAFSVVSPGTYGTSKFVTITTSTAGAAIYYTVDGVTTPSSSSLLYTGPVSVSSSLTIKAIAIKNGYSDSGILSGIFTIDSTAPTITSASVLTASPGTSLTPEVAFTLSEAATVALYDSNACTTAISSAAAKTSGANTMFTTSLTTNSVTTIYAKAVDAITNASTCTSIGSYTNDTTAPNITSANVSTASPGTSMTPTVAFTLSEAATVTLYSEIGCSAAISGAAAKTSGANTMFTTSLTANSVTTIYAKAVDTATNASTCTSIGSYTNDTTAPTITSVSVSTASPGTSLTPEVAFTLSEAATVALYDSNACTTAISSAAAKTSGANTMNTNSLTANAVTTIYAKAVDAATNASTCTSIGSYTNDTAAPTISSVSLTAPSGTTQSSCDATPGNCTMQDKLSGLWWSNRLPAFTWQTASDVCSDLTYNEVSEWRLPTADELVAAHTNGIYDAASENWLKTTDMTTYWSSTPYGGGDLMTGDLSDGTTSHFRDYWVIPVICVYDAAANPSAASNWIDVTTPFVTGTSGIGVNLDFTVTPSEAVTVTGTPTMPITIGGVSKTASYVSASSTSTSLVFRYTTQAGDNGLVATLSPVSGTITDPSLNVMTKTFTGENTTRKIDTVAPAICCASVTTTSPGSSLTPTVAFELSEGATVTLYDSDACTTPVSTSVFRGIGPASSAASMSTNSLTSNSTTTIYGKAVDFAGNGSACTSIGSYTNAVNPWTATTTIDAPAGRKDHTAVWTGSEMIVWGGTGSSNFNTGGLYDPVANSWSPTDTASINLPSARQLHTAVWTGSKMIVWGGFNGSGTSLNNGGLYDPVDNSWSATAITGNTPAARVSHTAVWTGSKMIVWGGYIYNTSSYFNDGGLYDPVGNSWSATTTTDAPSARYGNTTVWTGSKMIVWGGYNPNTYTFLNNGGLYDPVANSWSPTDTASINLPSARQMHTAVWTGSKMIVWGGRDASTLFNNGGLYDPVDNSWSATAITGNTPAGRTYHTAVWTGSKMIVWGGNDSTGIRLQDGGQYDPAAYSWSQTNTDSVDLPAARNYHTAVWTGDKMIVWGGRCTCMGIPFLNDGGVYAP